MPNSLAIPLDANQLVRWQRHQAARLPELSQNSFNAAFVSINQLLASEQCSLELKTAFLMVGLQALKNRFSLSALNGVLQLYISMQMTNLYIASISIDVRSSLSYELPNHIIRGAEPVRQPLLLAGVEPVADAPRGFLDNAFRSVMSFVTIAFSLTFLLAVERLNADPFASDRRYARSVNSASISISALNFFSDMLFTSTMAENIRINRRTALTASSSIRNFVSHHASGTIGAGVMFALMNVLSSRFSTNSMQAPAQVEQAEGEATTGLLVIAMMMASFSSYFFNLGQNNPRDMSDRLAGLAINDLLATAVRAAAYAPEPVMMGLGAATGRQNLFAGEIVFEARPLYIPRPVSQVANNFESSNQAVINSLASTDALTALGYVAPTDEELEPFLCPVNYQVMTDPVRLYDSETGHHFPHHYEREALERWLLVKETNPMSSESAVGYVVEADPYLAHKIDVFINDKQIEKCQAQMKLPDAPMGKLETEMQGLIAQRNNLQAKTLELNQIVPYVANNPMSSFYQPSNSAQEQPAGSSSLVFAIGEVD
jgi:hypothetical protein